MQIQIGEWVLREWHQNNLDSPVRCANNPNVSINLCSPFPLPLHHH